MSCGRSCETTKTTEGAFGSTSKSKISMGNRPRSNNKLESVANATMFAHLTQLTCVKKYRTKAWRSDPSGRPKKEIDRHLGEQFARFYLTAFW